MLPVIYLQIRSDHSKDVKAQRRAGTMNVAPTPFALAPPLNGNVVDVATTAVSTSIHSPSPNSFTPEFSGDGQKRELLTSW